MTTTFQAGQVLADRYDVLDSLPDGFLARDHVTGDHVLVAPVAASAVAELRDVLTICRQHCPAGLVLPLDVHHTAQGAFYTAAVSDGQTLRAEHDERLANEQRLSAAEAVALGTELLGLARRTPAELSTGPITLDVLVRDSHGGVRWHPRWSSLRTIRTPRERSRDVAAIVYELLTGRPAGPAALPAEQVRRNVPVQLSRVLQRALTARAGYTPAALSRALQQSQSSRRSFEAVLPVALAIVAILVAIALWHFNRPIPQHHTKADVAQRQGVVDGLRQQAERVEATLQAEAREARDALEKWQRELTSARDGNKPVQQAHAEQRLETLRPSADLSLGVAELWQQHSARQTWLTSAQGEWQAAESLAQDGQFDAAIEHLQVAEALWRRVLNWPRQARIALERQRTLELGLAARREHPLYAIGYAWPERQSAGIAESLRSTDGSDTMRRFDAAVNSLSVIDGLLKQREEVLTEDRTDDSLDEIAELRAQRAEIRTLVARADEELAAGEWDAARTGYCRAAERFQQFPAQALAQIVEIVRGTGRESAAVSALVNVGLSIPAQTDAARAARIELLLLQSDLNLAAGRPEAALSAVQQVLQLDARQVNALQMQAAIFNTLKRFAEARDVATRALELEPGSVSALRQRALARRALNDRNGAVADLTALLDHEGGDVALRVARGELLSELKDDDRAIADFEAILQGDPNHVGALAGRAHSRLLRGDRTGAVADANACLRHAPSHVPALVTRGAARMGNEELESAITDLATAVRLDAANVTARVVFAQALNRAGKFEQGRAEALQAMQLDSQCGTAMLALAQAQAGLRQTDAALVTLDQLLAREPAQLEARALHGDLQWHRGDAQAALQDFEAVLQNAPQHIGARLGRASHCAAHNQWDEAISDATVVLDSKPETSAEARALRIRAVAYNRTARFADAIADCTTALRLEPQVMETYVVRAAAQAELARWDEVIADCTAALKANSKSIDALRLRAKAWFQKGDSQRAQADYNEALRVERQSP